MVASTNAYYLNTGDEEAHRILACIRGDMQEKQLREREQGNQFHVFKDEHFLRAFKDYPAAIENSQKIADSCDVQLKFGEYVLPDYASQQTNLAGQEQADKEQKERKFEWHSFLAREERFPYRLSG